MVVVDARKRARLKHIHEVLDKPGVLVNVIDHHPPSEDDIRCEPSRLTISPIGATTRFIQIESFFGLMY